jgi:mannose-6-phosphate isomerase
MKDVHTEHCCKFHGCQYGDASCTVTNGAKRQSYACEICDSVGITIRPWGHFQVLADELTHKVKSITVEAGKRLSLQRHGKRSEYWVCVSGQGKVTLGDTLDNLKTFGFGLGGYIYIPIHFIHRVEADTDRDLTFIEVQQGFYFGEDDIERFEDDYGRA